MPQPIELSGEFLRSATHGTGWDWQAGQRAPGGQDAAERQRVDAEARIRRFQDAIAAGVDPAVRPAGRESDEFRGRLRSTHQSRSIRAREEP